MIRQLSGIMSNRLVRFLLIAGAIVAPAIAGYAIFTNRPISVRVARVEQNVPIRVFGLGTVEARVLSKVGFEVGAAIVELRADHGDLVKTGDMLARLHTAEQEAKVAKAQAGVLAAEVGIRRAEANVEKARAVLAQRQEANKRKQALVRGNVVSEQIAEEAQRDEDVAKAELSVALSEIEVARANLETAKAELEFESTLLAHHALTAPFDAMVIERHKEAGTVIKAGDPIFTLVAPDTVWGLAYIDESRAGPIAIGQPAEVRLRSLPRQVLEAKVVRIGIESDRVNEERRVYVKCDSCSAEFHLGEQAEILIRVATLDRALLVPEAAVAGYDGTKGTVWTVENGRLQRRSVTFGYRTEDGRLEITGGLPAGAEVVSELGTGLREGRRASAIAGPIR